MKKLLAMLMMAGALAIGSTAPDVSLAQATTADAKKDEAKAAPAAADAKKDEAKPEEKKEEAKPAPTPNKGDVAWMLTSPALALFYGGLVRAKNMLSVLMQVFVVFSMITVLWCIYGYSLAFTEGNPFFGGMSRLFLSGTFDSMKGEFAMAATFSKGVVLPELVFVAFQATFAAITCCLIFGALVERVKFSAILLFIAIWFTISYAPIAHMVWFWMGPDAYTGKDVVDAV